MRAWLCLGTVALLAACSSEVNTGSGGNGGSGNSGQASSSTTSSSSSSGMGGAGGGAPGTCPATLPMSGEACTNEGATCTYGDSPRPECRDVINCVQGQWIVVPVACAEPPPGTCPDAPPMNGVECPQEGAACAYMDGTICGCTSCTGGPCMPPPPKWSCGEPPAAGCPTIAPNVGQPCADEGQSCTYGVPCGVSGAITNCKDGVWQWEIIACPE